MPRVTRLAGKPLHPFLEEVAGTIAMDKQPYWRLSNKSGHDIEGLLRAINEGRNPYSLTVLEVLGAMGYVVEIRKKGKRK